MSALSQYVRCLLQSRPEKQREFRLIRSGPNKMKLLLVWAEPWCLLHVLLSKNETQALSIFACVLYESVSLLRQGASTDELAPGNPWLRQPLPCDNLYT